MSRPTKEVKSPAGKVAVVYTYLTGRERNRLRDVYTNAATMDGEGKMTMADASIASKASDLLIELALVSYDGKSGKEGIDALLDAPVSELDCLTQALNEIDTGFLAEKK